MRPEDVIRLRHMLDAAREALIFADGRTREELDTDRMLAMALVKEIEIIGEAAYQMVEESRKEIPDFPWPNIIGMRHRLIHAYAEIDLDVLWGTLVDDIPPLIKSLETILSENPEGK